ncbi:MAG TPA: hypothetical protein VIR57_19310 [Chloroflexota bacterium]
MTPQNQVTIGKCVCGHSRAAHQTKISRCGFCACLHFQLDDIVQEIKPSVPARRYHPAPRPDPGKR